MPGKVVVHLVGRLSESVVEFIGPICDALAKRGVPQTLVLFELQRGSDDLLSQVHDSVNLCSIPASYGPIVRWGRLLAAFKNQLRSQSIFAVHLHGMIPCLLGPLSCRRLMRQSSVFFSPHGSRVIRSGRWRASFLLKAFNPLSGKHAQKTIAGAHYEARALAYVASEPIAVLESPVDSAFFAVSRLESEVPLVVAGSLEPDRTAVALFSRIAVLARQQDPALEFLWLGPLDSGMECELRAAGARHGNPLDAELRKGFLANAWVFVAAGVGRSFPYRMAEAMALGIPCVAIDSAGSRDVLKDGETGFLCRHSDEVVTRVAQLLDSMALRESVGEAGRREARTRFSEVGFRSALLSLYQLERRQAVRHRAA